MRQHHNVKDRSADKRKKLLLCLPNTTILARPAQFELQRLCPKMFDFYFYLLFVPFIFNVFIVRSTFLGLPIFFLGLSLQGN